MWTQKLKVISLI